MQRAALEKIAGLVGDLPALPSVAAEALRLLTDPSSEPEQLQHVLSRDAALSLKVLRLANSAYYRRKSAVSTLSAAIILLGFRTIQSLILSSAVHRVLSSNGAAASLWEHSLATAFACRELSRQSPVCSVDPEEAFLAGLFHDTAKSVIATKFPGIYAKPLGASGEEELLGFHHGHLGQLLLSKWEIPARLAEAVGSHHSPEPSDLGRLALAADWLAWEAAPGLGACRPLPPEHLLAQLGADSVVLESIRESLAGSMAEELGADAA
ncbi:MAG: HDOD domain-containing protein [Deltaproteobacteria bacterium]|nr:HDOD domain-containing protein [Deltaproteobacteria bacterium]